jgi:small redox-active disulfide protein 2
MIIKILGSGCANCQKLETLAHQAVDELGLDAQIVHVTDFADIMAFGIMTTPGLVVDDQVKMAGRVPSYEDVKKIIGAAAAR